MKSLLQKGITVLLSACGMTLMADNANAFINMPDRERVQAIAWTIEGATVVVIVLVFWFIWRIGKRAQANRKSRQENSLE